MDSQETPNNEPGRARAAPFTYGQRRQSVFGTDADLEDAVRANRSAQRLTRAEQKGHGFKGRRSSRLGGSALDMTAAVHRRARLSCMLDGGLLQAADAAAAGAATGGQPHSASPFLSPSSLSTSFPPLVVEPVPGCLWALHYTRSARAWDTLASGCLAEAAQLSETDNDVIAWAACFILSGDIQRGLMLLESYVVATCVVVHEMLSGVLGRLPKGVNPFSKRRDDQGGGQAAVYDGTANPYVQRKCLERHTQVLAAWMRCRSIYSERPPPELASYDVNTSRTPEAVVRHVVLQSMQLIDAAEVHRWYIIALMLFVPADVGSSRGSDDGASGDGHGLTHQHHHHHKSSRKKNRHNNNNGAGSFSVNTVASSLADRGDRDADPVFSSTRGVSSMAAMTGGVAEEERRTFASDGYRAPQNLWFRYFFALEECPGAPGKNSKDSPPHNRDDGSATLLPTENYSESGSNGSDSNGSGPTAAASPLLVSSGSSAESGKDNGRKGSFAAQRGGKLARTLSWFLERSKSSNNSQGARGATVHSNTRVHDASGASFPAGGGSLATKAPPWYLSATVTLDQEQTCSLLLSHREEWDVYFITAVTAFYTHHYRTSMMAASRFLRWAETHGGDKSPPAQQDTNENDDDDNDDERGIICGQVNNSSTSPPSSQQVTVPGLQRYQQCLAIFLRAWSALQIGERLQAGKDILALLENKVDTLGFHVGCALGLYGLPLPQAKDTLLTAAHNFTSATTKAIGPNKPAPTSFSTRVQGYLYLLTEAVHATMLLQLGLVQATADVATTALQSAATSGLTEEDTLPLGALRDVLVVAATALEDANAVLDVTLSPHRLAYVAVCPAFFGGLCASGIRVKAHSATHRLLYPLNLPLYASTRQVLPFHMNRAVFLYHAGRMNSAWDDVCCAVAAADEVAGSTEFAFSDCFPLRVYYFAITVGLSLLESLLAADLEAAKACLANPADQKAVEDKDTRLQEDELLSKEIVHICHDIVQRMQYFYPHSRLTELCHAQISIVCGGKDYLAQAVALSRRYPHSPATQNMLTLALYFDHHIPEAVDNARKNLQTFPHSIETIHMHHMLQKKHVIYNFNYRKLLPIRYKPGKHDRVFTKRMVFVLILLAANLVVLCLTAYVNAPSVRNMPGGLRFLAVRMQLPILAPLFFAAVFVIHAIVAAVTTKNLIATLLTDLFFVNTPLNRALFCLRCIPLVNLVDALLVSTLGNNFLFESGSATFVLYFLLAILFVPFTTRIWFLPSVDEPDVGFMSWLSILGVDVVVAIFVVIPHILFAFLEPYMLVLFYFFAPAERPGSEKGAPPPSSSIRRRLLLHAHDSGSMPRRFATGSGSHFLHIVVLKWLYVWSHCTMETRFLAEAQLEAENYRVFPLVEGEEAEALYAHVSQAPLCAAATATEEEGVTPSTGKAKNKRKARTEERKSSGSSSNSSNSSDTKRAGDTQGRDTAAPHFPRATSAAAARRRFTHRQQVAHASSSFSSSSSSSNSSSTTSSSASSQSSSSSSSSSSSGSRSSSPLTGVRTVEAMRQLFDRTSNDRPSAMQRNASFVRSNKQNSLDFVLYDNSDSSSGSEDGWEEFTGDRGSGTRHEAAKDGDSGEGWLAATLQFSEDIFNPNMDAQVHRREHHSLYRSADGTSPHNNGSLHYDVAQDSGSPDAASFHLDNDDVAVLNAYGDAATTDGGAAQMPTAAEANFHYMDDYAAQNRLGWFAGHATGGGAGSNSNQQDSRDDPSAFDF